jgi:hypothetical protein
MPSGLKAILKSESSMQQQQQQQQQQKQQHLLAAAARVRGRSVPNNENSERWKGYKTNIKKGGTSEKVRESFEARRYYKGFAAIL